MGLFLCVDASGQTKSKFLKPLPVKIHIPFLHRAQTEERARVTSGGWQEKGHTVDARVLSRSVQSQLCDGAPEADRLAGEDQTEIPVFAFALESAPADIGAVVEKRPMPKA